MRFTKLFAAVLCSLAALAASGQNLRDEIAANPGKSGGVYYVYTYDNPVLTPAPKGYKPFYISHYGRHGSRWLLHDSEYDEVMAVFRAADAANAFTERGREVYGRVKRVYDDGIGAAIFRPSAPSSTGRSPRACTAISPKYSAPARSSMRRRPSWCGAC